ncbi:MAG TPA: Gldg family protein [Clostridia bacterium]|nr:Gldg family protein [Clostridia bacterium]
MTRKPAIRAAVLGAGALILVFLLNWGASALPAWDTTAGGLITPSKQASATIRALSEPVTLYLIASEGTEDAYLQALLRNLARLNSNLSYERVLPADGRLSAYSEAALADNSVVVASARRFALLDRAGLYEYDQAYDYYSGGNVVTDVRFAAEDRVVRALTYVASELPTAYLLAGHGEPAIGAGLRGALQDAGVGLTLLDLGKAGALPDDAALVIVNAPIQDLSANELALLEHYLSAGGRMLVTTDATKAPLTRLSSLLGAYGMRMKSGLVLESDSKRYIQSNGQSYKQYLLPMISGHESVQASALEALKVIIPMAHGIETVPNLRDTLTVSPLLTTGETAYLKENINQLTTLDRVSADVGGPFDVAVAAEEAGQGATTRIVWVASGVFLGDNAFQASGGANASLLGELLGWMTPLPGRTNYPVKSMTAVALTIPQAARIAMLILWLGLPAALLIVAAAKAARRRSA